MQNLNYSGQAGGYGGASFEDIMPLDATISYLTIYSGQYVHGFEILYLDGDGNTGKLKIGKQYGNEHKQSFDKGVTITGISGRAGQYVDSIRLHFSNGAKTQLCGGNGGGDYYITVPASAYSVGFYGRSGDYLDKIGLVFKQ